MRLRVPVIAALFTLPIASVVATWALWRFDGCRRADGYRYTVEGGCGDFPEWLTTYVTGAIIGMVVAACVGFAVYAALGLIQHHRGSRSGRERRDALRRLSEQ